MIVLRCSHLTPFHLLQLCGCNLLVNSQTCFNLELKMSYKTKHHPTRFESTMRWTLKYIISVFCALLVLISAVPFTVFLSISSITWPWHVLGCSTDRTSETCKYLKDFWEISPSPIDLCIEVKKRWMSAGWCCHRTAVCTTCAHQSKSCLLPSGAMTMRWHQKHTAMKCNQTEVSMNVTSVRKKGFSLIL